MLDIKLVRENPDIIRKDLEKRDRRDLIKKLDNWHDPCYTLYHK